MPAGSSSTWNRVVWASSLRAISAERWATVCGEPRTTAGGGGWAASACSVAGLAAGAGVLARASKSASAASVSSARLQRRERAAVPASPAARRSARPWRRWPAWRARPCPARLRGSAALALTAGRRAAAALRPGPGRRSGSRRRTRPGPSPPAGADVALALERDQLRARQQVGWTSSTAFDGRPGPPGRRHRQRLGCGRRQTLFRRGRRRAAGAAAASSPGRIRAACFSACAPMSSPVGIARLTQAEGALRHRPVGIERQDGRARHRPGRCEQLAAASAACRVAGRGQRRLGRLRRVEQRRHQGREQVAAARRIGVGAGPGDGRSSGDRRGLHERRGVFRPVAPAARSCSSSAEATPAPLRFIGASQL